MLYLDLERTSDLAMEDLAIKKLHVITPKSDTYPMAPNVEVTNLTQFITETLARESR